MEHFDVLIVGAGISGIGAAYHLQTKCPGKTYAILEGREALGGTWDLFRYPGIRSDSDMYTLGFSFKPWTKECAIADGNAILEYLIETAQENHIDEHIRYSQLVRSASWSSETARWILSVEHDGAILQYSCGFLFTCGGYYNYENGYTPDFPAIDSYQGVVVHPQHWPENLDYKGKRVLVIGSGATAVTLVPSLAKTAAHVTMLQRSPTYMMARPSRDPLAKRIRRYLPEKAAYNLIRWKNVGITMLFYNQSKSRPAKIAKFLIDSVRKELRDGYDIDTHFTPRYAPWDQRVCLVPDGDFFKSINEGRASVVTDEIETFTEAGVQLKSGETIAADIVVTATGLTLQLMGGIKLTVDGKDVQVSDSMTYKAMMLSDIPNLALWFGYTNASWTLKCDLTSEYLCRLITHMDTQGYTTCVPRRLDPRVEEAAFVPLKAGYIERGKHLLPKQGDRAPWKLKQNYAFDIASIRYSDVDDGVMEFS
jgi:cation diffusion facilitator CzcD-associated flavoprotein CzcO